MLKDLKILNGEMTLKFDSLNTTYTVKLNEGESNLEFEYEIAEGDKISVYGNDDLKDNAKIVLTVYNDDDMMSYYITVYKEQTKEALAPSNSLTSLEIKNTKEVPEYAAPCIASVCFLTILLFFTLLFKKNKKY